ncbi:MAG: hypothetical protein V1766_02225 [Pseudomonadota bacterium]
MAISDDDIKKFMERATSDASAFSPADREIIKSLALTINCQSETIAKLSWELQGKTLLTNKFKNALNGIDLEKLTGLMGSTAGTGFDFDAARAGMIQMSKEIAQANDLKEAFGAIVKFAMFVAPMI